MKFETLSMICLSVLAFGCILCIRFGRFTFSCICICFKILLLVSSYLVARIEIVVPYLIQVFCTGFQFSQLIAYSHFLVWKRHMTVYQPSTSTIYIYINVRNNGPIGGTHRKPDRTIWFRWCSGWSSFCSLQKLWAKILRASACASGFGMV